jgi:hypothetical protein
MPSDEKRKPSVSDSFLRPRPVDPEEARRRQPAPAVDVDRSVVELTSPIGHRLRVPQAGDESVVSDLPPAGDPPKSKKKRR